MSLLLVVNGKLINASKIVNKESSDLLKQKGRKFPFAACRLSFREGEVHNISHWTYLRD